LWAPPSAAALVDIFPAARCEFVAVASPPTAAVKSFFFRGTHVDKIFSSSLRAENPSVGGSGSGGGARPPSPWFVKNSANRDSGGDGDFSAVRVADDDDDNCNQESRRRRRR
jgi:hypothetical protein